MKAKTLQPDIGARYVVRLYLATGGDVQVYDNVKHVWWTGDSTVLSILQYRDDGTYRYVNWLRERITWYQMTPQS